MKLVIGNKKYSSWSLRPWIAMKHFDLPFTEELIPLDTPQTTDEIRRVSPSGRVPLLVDAGRTVWESLAILEYLNECYPEKRMWPSNSGDRAFARSISNEMHSGFLALRGNCPMKTIKHYPGFRPNEAAERDLKRIDLIWREALERSGGPYLFGDFTIADAMYAPVVLRIRTYDIKPSSAAQAYVQTMLANSAMRKWISDAEKEPFGMNRYDHDL